MIYRTFKKVSNVCQVLDKSKYPATQTINGVTFTNNGDGSITVNGTATGLCQYRITNSYKKLIGENTNKCLLVGSISANSGTPYYLQLDFVEGNSWSRAALDFGKGVIFTNSDTSTQLLSIIVKSGVIVNNLVFKPQLFDLTEMYGAGNEPTTVAQFRQDFHEEMYDYSPHCFVKSYKNMMICKTKNLFPTSTVAGTLNGWGQSTTRQFEEDKWYIGITRNNYYVPNNITEYELTENYVYYYSISAGYGLGRAFKCEPNQTYTISCKWIKTGDTQYIGTGFYDENGNYLTNITSGALPKRFTIATPANCKWFTVVFSGQGYVYNIQIEKGSTATDFIPNGYLQSYKKSLVCKTKNMFDINSVSNLNNWVDKQSVDRPYGYYQFNLKPNTTYTFQRNYKSRNNEVFACFSKKYGVSDEQGFFIHPTDSYLTRKQLSFTTDDTGIMYLNVYRVTSVLSSFIELIEGAQLELGDTATDYVPYGHL